MKQGNLWILSVHLKTNNLRLHFNENSNEFYQEV